MSYAGVRSRKIGTSTVVITSMPAHHRRRGETIILGALQLSGGDGYVDRLRTRAPSRRLLNLGASRELSVEVDRQPKSGKGWGDESRSGDDAAEIWSRGSPTRRTTAPPGSTARNAGAPLAESDGKRDPSLRSRLRRGTSPYSSGRASRGDGGIIIVASSCNKNHRLKRIAERSMSRQQLLLGGYFGSDGRRWRVLSANVDRHLERAVHDITGVSAARRPHSPSLHTCAR